MFSTNQWLRENKVAMWILTVLRVYIGYDWMTHGSEQIDWRISSWRFLGRCGRKSNG